MAERTRTTDLPRIHVRPMELDEVGIRIEYFLGASDEFLTTMGVDRTALPTREAWHAAYVEEYALPLRDRPVVSLVWEVEDEVVGFSTADRIVPGHEAYMHLHLVNAELRGRGLGTRFVRESARTYVELLELARLYCEANAFNTAPHRTVQRAGFRYVLTHHAQPLPINFPQITTRWVIERVDLDLGDPFDR